VGIWAGINLFGFNINKLIIKYFPHTNIEIIKYFSVSLILDYLYYLILNLIMPAQLNRILLLFIAFIGLFLLVRHFLIPESFGQYGHYRGESLNDIASR